jgi:hypothetical protein
MPEDESYTHSDLVSKELGGDLKEGSKSERREEAYTHAELAAKAMGANKGAIKFKGECPCGFSFITPHGEDDAVAMMQYHVTLIHKKEYPKGITKSEASAHVKKV